ncbi:pitrilysin family protein [Rhodocytophaga aerolata]|uniref:Pitrilysin family protein n=1 Tax=Rhodocytophaga aerolata TaxID=455078 RepID=A0ABT8R4W6_9BACT|nr:pitrilysin family protein [Rhodocytophaga aerolata]MDO1447120.1 pitrilysin family protein [Rhodocytophaga aerolata]
MQFFRKRYILLFFQLLISSVIFAQAKTARPGSFTLPPYTKFTLSNGLTVYLMEQHEVPVIHVSALFPAGAIQDEKKAGLASLTADALLFGTKSYTKSQIEEQMDFLGASVNTYAAQEYAAVQVSFMATHQDKVLPILKEIMVNPVFTEEEFVKKQKRLAVELDQQRESPREVIGTYFNSFLYGDHPYGNPLSGTKATVSALSVADAKDFYSTYYTPNGSAIALVGDFKTKDMRSKLEKLLKDWKKKENTAIKAKEVPLPLYQKNRVLLVNKDNATETTFYIGAPGISRNNPDYVAIQVINTVLGGRFTSWLNDELRVNSGLTYGARSSFTPLKTNGSFTISTFTKTATTTEAIDLALEVVNRLHSKGIDEETLSSAKNYIKGQFPPRFETSGDLASLLTSMFWYTFDESYINTFQQKVDELTTAKAKEIITRYFPKENLQFVLIGKASEIQDKVKKYGEITVKQITADEF